MALVVETGSGVVGANSYLTVAELRAFALDRGLTLPTPDDEVSALLIQASDYLELKEYIGTPVADDQGLAWPRNTADWFGRVVALGVPDRVKKAQALLAIEAQNGELSAAARPSPYTRTKIDSLDVTYASASKQAIGMQYLAIDALLAQYYTAGSGRTIQTIRA